MAIYLARVDPDAGPVNQRERGANTPGRLLAASAEPDWRRGV